MSDVTVIDYRATATISPVVGTDPEAIRTAVRQQTVATVEDLKRPCEEDLEAARQIVPLIAVRAARGSVKVGGAQAAAVTEAVTQGLLEGAAQIGPSAESAVRHALWDTDKAYQHAIARTRADRTKAAR